MSAFNRKHNMRQAYHSLRASRGRNGVTMVGIVIGVMAIVLMVCIGQGIRKQISGQLGQYGKQAFIVRPSSDGQNGFAGFNGYNAIGLSNTDVTTVQKTPGVQYVVPLATATGSMSGDHTVKTPFILATSADFTKVIKQHIQTGGFFEDDDSVKSAVLGANIAHRLFDDGAPIGQILTWRGQHFVVAGVFDTFAAPPFSLEANFNDGVFVPYDTAQKLSNGSLGVYQVVATAKSGADTNTVVSAVQQRLTAAHGGAQDVIAATTNDSSSAPNQTLNLLTMFVYGAALIALIVGSIGIMNVMLVTVTERMHEIGLRKAIGATNRQILRQFATEAFLLSAIGAVIGVALSCIAVGLLRLFTSIQPVLVWQILVLAPVIAIIVGTFFGSLPAVKAARKDPIEALRHE